jgi:DnaJ-class molecular chaperone
MFQTVQHNKRRRLPYGICWSCEGTGRSTGPSHTCPKCRGTGKFDAERYRMTHPLPHQRIAA